METAALELKPGKLMLLDTMETVRIPNDCCGMLSLKSSMGRIGLEHMHAGFFDPGFIGTATLEVYVAAPWPVIIEQGQRIVQLTLMKMLAEPDVLYNGKYQNQSTPTEHR
jgi:dCTP deaminase